MDEVENDNFRKHCDGAHRAGFTMRNGKHFSDELRKRLRTIYVSMVKSYQTRPIIPRFAVDPALSRGSSIAPENRVSPDTGQPVWRCYQIRRSHTEVAGKRLAAEKWAEESFGVMGRSPIKTKRD